MSTKTLLSIFVISLVLTLMGVSSETVIKVIAVIVIILGANVVDKRFEKLESEVSGLKYRVSELDGGE